VSLQEGDVRLRPVERDDVAQLHAWQLDHDSWHLGEDVAYAPTPLAAVLRRYDEGKAWQPDERYVPFAVERGGALVGTVCLWGLDAHNRSGHLGIALAPDSRGRGVGRVACRLLLQHAFLDRGLHRVQLEVLASNERAVRAYEAAGFVHEGRLREQAWVLGSFEDSLVMSVLSSDWTPGTG
jgi:RimJ/RimL family protein N-acetyltransferase